ncbi:MAG TPA: toxin-antitoxin system YwqK family antitoxin [Candidatus Binataceae bacterium]|nr:toxin-antitoxin system YwqK family antitoxin [Candidatus Binataceae bacterium]
MSQRRRPSEVGVATEIAGGACAARPARLLLASLMALAAMVSIGCRRADVPPSCPPGAKLMGAPPPKGEEVWCQKTVQGKPIKNGPFIAYQTSGSRMLEGDYRDGKQDGEWTLWYENGAKASIDHYRNGVRDGLHTSWYANGQKSIEGDYRDDQRDGVWMRWDPSGLSGQKMVYANGKLVH